jgi:hypothetical protein
MKFNAQHTLGIYLAYRKIKAYLISKGITAETATELALSYIAENTIQH